MGAAHDAPAEGRPISFAWSLVPVAALIALLAVTIIVLKGSGHIPLLLGACVAGLVAWYHGYSWKAIQAGIVHSISLAMGAILILLVIGVLMGTWLASGIVPALMTWGLKLLSPNWFLPATCAVCSIVSLVSGSSWSTAGTVGLALVGVSEAMGIDTAMTAGAVISGAYFGDKLSPMSDTTNLAPAMAGTELFPHIRHMLWTTGPAWVLSMIAFTLIGLNMEGGADPEEIATITAVLEAQFHPSWIHLLVPLVVGVMVFMEFPALPTLVVAALLGGVLAWASGVPVAAVVQIAVEGFNPIRGSTRSTSSCAAAACSAWAAR